MDTIIRKYHTRDIRKGEHGKFSKVVEEIEELLDLYANGTSRILMYCEIADVTVALQSWITRSASLDIKLNYTFGHKVDAIDERCKQPLAVLAKIIEDVIRPLHDMCEDDLNNLPDEKMSEILMLVHSFMQSYMDERNTPIGSKDISALMEATIKSFDHE